jgi:methionine synthase II (cobalamin-independent)
VTQVTGSPLTTPACDFDGAAFEQRAAGLPSLIRALASRPASHRPALVKGQVCGPFTLARASGDDPADWVTAVAEAAIHQIQRLRPLAGTVLVVLDEPALTSKLPPGSQTPRRAATAILKPIADRIRQAGGMVGIHDCGHPRLDSLADLGPVVLLFDAAQHLDMVMAAKAQREVLAHHLTEPGYGIGWGIVPTSPPFDHPLPSVASIVQRLVSAHRRLGSPPRFFERSLITPACGLAGLTPARAAKVARLTVAVCEQLLAASLGRPGNTQAS